MPTLSTKDLDQLGERGISVEKESGGIRYVFTLTGVYWLLNYHYQSRSSGTKQRLTAGFLKNLANTPVLQDARSLRVKAIELPVYSGDKGFQLAFYLNGSPPRLLHNTDFLPYISDQVPFLQRSSAIALIGDTEALWRLSENEQQRLAAAGLVEHG